MDLRPVLRVSVKFSDGGSVAEPGNKQRGMGIIVTGAVIAVVVVALVIFYQIRLEAPSGTSQQASSVTPADVESEDVESEDGNSATEGVEMTENEGTADLVTTSSGLQYQDHAVGDGDLPETGQTVVVHYTGWLYENGEKGDKFDSSVDRGQPFEFPLGQGRVIGGWDEGLASMRVGGRRTLILPPDLGYGAGGAGSIPGGATLMFDVELLDIR